VVYPKESVLFSHTSLGKLIAVSLILLYGSYKYVYGLFVCVLVIFYYQTNIVNDIVTTHLLTKRYGSLEGMKTQHSAVIVPAPEMDANPVLSEEPLSNDVYETVEDSFVKPFEKYEPTMNTYEPAVPFNAQNEDILSGMDKKAKLKQIFRQQYCKNGKLEMKGEEVKPEMAEHVFSELSSTQCNPCDESCDFSVIEEKLKTEEELKTPKDSNEWIDIANETFSNISSIPAYFSQYIPNWNIAAYT
jgi:hypothetical protein